MANQQSLLILIMIVFLGIIGGYFYYSTIAVPGIEPLPTAPIPQNDNLKAFESLNINYEILTNTKFKSLDAVIQKVDPGATGKRDLFLP